MAAYREAFRNHDGARTWGYDDIRGGDPVLHPEVRLTREQMRQADKLFLDGMGAHPEGALKYAFGGAATAIQHAENES
ncbi:MAG: hypothetical protein SangKO_042770 [Sandaracinaceae bacterium]